MNEPSLQPDNQNNLAQTPELQVTPLQKNNFRKQAIIGGGGSYGFNPIFFYWLCFVQK